MKSWNTIPSDAVIAETVAALSANGMTAEVVATKEEARERVLSMLPPKAEVMDMTSITLTEAGIQQAIYDTGFRSVVKKTLVRLQDAKEKRRLGAAPDYAIGSVHAVTQDGHVVIASNTGSQLPSYAYGAEHVIWVVGVQKIVKNMDEGLQRIYKYVLPLEAERMQKAHGVKGSNVSKLLIINKEIKANRIHIVFIKESIGF